MDDTNIAALLGCERSAVHDELCHQLRALLLHDPDERLRSWRAAVRTSSVPGSGDGVHIEGSCAAGTVLAIYPGVSFLPDDLPVMHEIVLKGNSYVLARCAAH